MIAQWLNTVGLTVNIAGAVIVVLFAFPQPSFEQEGELALEDANIHESGKTYGEVRAERKIMKRKYRFRSKIGLVAMAIGFGFQLMATWAA